MIRRPVARTVGRTALIAGTATAVSGRVARRQDMRYQESMAPAPAPEQYPQPEPAGGPSSTNIEQLQQLAELKSQGVLTDEEFAAEKAKILNG